MKYATLKIVLVAGLTLIMLSGLYAQPTYVSYVSNSGTSNSPSVNRPTTYAENDLFIIGITFDDGADINITTVPDGWTLIRRTNSSDSGADEMGFATYWKKATASEGASYTFGLNSSQEWIVTITRITGAHLTTPINISSGNNGDGDDIQSNSVTTTADNCLILSYHNFLNNETLSQPTSTIRRFNIELNTGGADLTQMMATFTVATAGSSGAKTSSNDFSDDYWIAQQIAIAPAVICIPPSITSVTAAANPICPGTTTTLSATGVAGTNAVVTWWTGAGGTGSNLGTGTTTTQGPGTYYARVTGDCTPAAEASITVDGKVAPVITSVTAAANPICPGTTTTLTANGVAGTNAVVTWWTGAGGTGSNLGTGTTTTQGPGTYYARVTGDCTPAAEASITVNAKINVGITDVTAAASPICPASTTTLTANGVVGTNAVVTWHTATGGGGTNLGTGLTKDVGPGTYFARVTGDCGDPAEASVTVGAKVNVGITDVTAAASPICPAATTTLTANGVVGTNAIVIWYTATGGGGTNLGTGSTKDVGPGTYFARVTGDCGDPAEASVTVNAKTLSEKATGITRSDNYTCPGDPVTLTVTGGSLGTGAVWKWYSGGCEGTYIEDGASITVNPMVTTTYYVKAEGDCNTTACISKTVTVHPPTEIVTQPVDISTIYGCPAPKFTVSATGHNLKYQWFKNTSDSNTGGEAIPLAIFSWYQPEYTEIGDYFYYVEVKGTCGTEVSDPATLTVEPQIAEAVGELYYTGPAFAFTANPTSSTATVVLSATIKNNLWKNCFDGSVSGGDIRTARMSFEINKGQGWEKIPSATNLPVEYVDPNDIYSGGTASAVVQIQMPSGTSMCDVDIKVVLGGNYKSDERLMWSTLTLVIPQQGGYIAGGVWLCNGNSTGYLKGEGKSFLNFTVAYTNTTKTKGAQNPKGRVVLYIVSMNKPDGTPDFMPHWYRITSNAIANLSISFPKATFTAKSNLVELHWDGSTTPLDGNCAMVLELQQATKWPWLHLAGITVNRNKNLGGIWYSNNWIKGKTVMAPICGGGFTIAGGASGISETTETTVKSATLSPETDMNGLRVYPNPFSDKVRFEFVPEISAQARIDIFDITGRMVKTIFDNPVEATVKYTAEFEPADKVSGMYMYRMTLGNEVFNGKVVYRK